MSAKWFLIISGVGAALAGCAPTGTQASPESAPIAMPLQAHMVQTRQVLSSDRAASWNLTQIGQDAVELRGTSQARVVVAIMDTGADPGHPALRPRMYPPIDVVGTDVYRGAGPPSTTPGSTATGTAPMWPGWSLPSRRART